MGHRTTEEGKGTQKSGNVDWGYLGGNGQKMWAKVQRANAKKR